MSFSTATLGPPAVTPAASVARMMSVVVASGKSLRAGITSGWLLLLRPKGS